MKRKQFLLLMSILIPIVTIGFTLLEFYLLDPNRLNVTIIFSTYTAGMIWATCYWDSYLTLKNKK
jgi:hypothetical protein